MMILKVYASGRSGGGKGGGNTINGQYPPAQTGYNGQRNPSGTPGRGGGRVRVTIRPNRQGMNPARYGPMM